MIGEIKNVISIDFHVHTPASKCYNREGKNEDEAYKELLIKIDESELDAVCITDHNTIKGYKKIKGIFEESEAKLNVYNKIKEASGDIPESLGEEFIQLNNIKRLFDRVKVFPGVEFTTQDQIHMLVVFDNKLDVESIEQFLYRGGYEQRSQGDDESGVLSNWTVIDLLEEVAKVFDRQAIVLAAHVDRKKGIWESLEGSIYKASIIKSQKLVGITYNTPSTKEVIKNTLNNKEYKRTGAVPLAFLQCSDYHNQNGELIGTPRAYFKVDELEFKDLQRAFSNPDEYISSPAPLQTMMVITELINNNDNVTLVGFRGADQLDDICKSVCALANSDYGNIIIGIDAKRNPVGIDTTLDEINEVVNDIRQCIIPTPKIDFEVYEFGKRKIISLRVSSGQEYLYWYKNKSYFRIKGQLVEGNPQNILNHVQDRMINKYNEILTINKNKLKKIHDMLSTYSDGIEVIKYINDFDKNTIPIGEVLKLQLIKWNKELPKNKLKPFESGGNTIILDNSEPRIKKAVYRFLPRKNTIPIEDIERMKLKKVSGEKIYISNGGAVHYDNTDNAYILPTTGRGLVLKVNDKYSQQISTKFVAAFLKSCALLYYVNLINDTFNIYRPEVFKKLRIPKNIPVETMNCINELVDEITKCENEFVVIMEQNCKVCKEESVGENCSASVKELCDKHMTEHNSKIFMIMRKIDNEIYNLLGVDDETICRIEEVLERTFSEEF